MGDNQAAMPSCRGQQHWHADGIVVLKLQEDGICLLASSLCAGPHTVQHELGQCGQALHAA